MHVLYIYICIYIYIHNVLPYRACVNHKPVHGYSLLRLASSPRLPSHSQRPAATSFLRWNDVCGWVPNDEKTHHPQSQTRWKCQISHYIPLWVHPWNILGGSFSLMSHNPFGTHLAPIDYAETAVQPWSCVVKAEWESNMAMENPPLIADFPILTSIHKGFPSQPCLITRG